jgi:DegV family protein with EDD domain
MKNIAIVTDTDSSLPADVAAQYNIRQVPITVHFDADTYTTGIDIDDTRLFQLVDQHKKLPTTSAPAPGAFVAAFKSAFDEGADAIACVCVSSKVSATYASAVSACQDFPGREIAVIDSLNLSMGQGFMVLAAAEAARAGASLAEVTARAEDTGRRVHLYAVLSTLKYLALSGRVGKLTAGMADTLNIKPLLTIVDGKLEMLEKVRTRGKAIDRMMELVKKSVEAKGVEQAAIVHITDPTGALDLRGRVCKEIACPDNIQIAEFTPGLSVHAGTRVVGIVVVEAA